MTSFAELLDLSQGVAAGHFGAGLDGAQVCAWFPVSLTGAQPGREGLASFTHALGPVAVGPARVRTRDPLQAVKRRDLLVSVSLSRAVWNEAFGPDALPDEGKTTFVIGPALNDGTPDPERAVRCTVEDEIRAVGGALEIDARKHPGFFGSS